MTPPSCSNPLKQELKTRSRHSRSKPTRHIPALQVSKLAFILQELRGTSPAVSPNRSDVRLRAPNITRESGYADFRPPARSFSCCLSCMAAACRWDGSDHFSAIKPYPVPNCNESYRGSLISFPPRPPNKGKRNTQDKGKENSVCPTRPPPTPRCGPKLRLTSIYLHRGGRVLCYATYSQISASDQPCLWSSVSEENGHDE